MSPAPRDESTPVVKIRSGAPLSEDVRSVLSELRRGAPVILPTETFYALCADSSREDSIARVIRLKGRETGKPIAIVIKDKLSVGPLVKNIPEDAAVLMERFWPGPLTLIFEASKEVPSLLLAGGRTLGIRVPDHPLLIQILREIHFPLTATSANRSGGESPVSAGQASDAFRGKGVLTVDAGSTRGGKPSTILDVTAMPFRIVREGAVSYEVLAAGMGGEVIR